MGFEDKYKDMTLEEKKAALKQLKKGMPFMIPGMTEEEAKSKEEEIKSREEEIKYLKGSINAEKSRKNLGNLANNLREGIGGGVNNVKEGLKDIKEYNETIEKYNEENTNTNKNKTLDENINKATFNNTMPKSDEKNTTGNTTTGNTTTTTNDTTTTTPETTLTKESAWNDYNKQDGTAKGLFESFNTLGMTAEEARKEFLNKVSTPSDAAKKAFKETYGVDLVVTDDKDDDKDKNKNKKYKSSMYGIIDAMKNGDIEPSTGIYFMLDALSKAARNTGIDIGNIGAQFSGGTVRDDYQDSLWNQRRSKMFENEMSSELNKQEGTDKELEYNLAKEDLIGKGLSNEQADLALNASRTFNDKAEEFRKAGNDTMADLYALVGSAATKEVGPEEIAAIAASGILNTPEGKEAADEIIKSLTGLVGTVGNTLGGINEVLSFFTDWKNKKNK